MSTHSEDTSAETDRQPRSGQAESGPVAARSKGLNAYPYIIGCIAIVGAFLVMQSGVSGGRFSLSLAEVHANPARYVDQQVKLVGKIKAGWTEEQVGNRIETQFTVEDGKGNEVRVIYPHNRPDPFKEGRECIVEGTMKVGHVLHGTKLTVKCPSKYQSEDDLETGDDSFKELRDRYKPGK